MVGRNVSFVSAVASLRRRMLRTIVPEWVWPRSVMIDDVPFRVQKEPYTVGTKKLLAFGTDKYEAEERLLVKRFVTPGMSVLELGTSIGVLSSIIAERIGPSGNPISVEASSEIGEYSKSWIEREYPWVQVVIGAGLPVWDSTPLLLSVGGFDGSRGSLGGAVMFRKSDENIPVSPVSPAGKIWDISQLSEKSPVPFEALIVDIEGGEEEIAGVTLSFPKSLQWVMVELHPEKYRNQAAGQAILKRIEEEGFEPHSELGNSYLLSQRN